uniref:NADH-ubiquinone oxidoreductase chain 6 n=1 Tax=Quedenfeldtia trachyblepharus TaxID=460631 RepID=A0A343J8Q8_9SAUR|nr:NADH dehydrogenase subunit 6 [Quedenfeldtia trachyblepharus]
MMYVVFLLGVCSVLGFVGVAANPSPLFGAIGLVLAAVGGCGVLLGFGGSFVSLVLFLIYLGGMLVVFAYSVALSAESYLETWGDYSVLYYVVGLFFMVLMGVGVFGEWAFLSGWGALGEDSGGVFVFRVGFSGAMLLYSWGGGLLVLCGGALMLALFVVLELTRGLARGGLRAV